MFNNKIKWMGVSVGVFVGAFVLLGSACQESLRFRDDLGREEEQRRASSVSGLGLGLSSASIECADDAVDASRAYLALVDEEDNVLVMVGDDDEDWELPSARCVPETDTVSECAIDSFVNNFFGGDVKRGRELEQEFKKNTRFVTSFSYDFEKGKPQPGQQVSSAAALNQRKMELEQELGRTESCVVVFETKKTMRDILGGNEGVSGASGKSPQNAKGSSTKGKLRGSKNWRMMPSKELPAALRAPKVMDAELSRVREACSSDGVDCVKEMTDFMRRPLRIESAMEPEPELELELEPEPEPEPESGVGSGSASRSVPKREAQPRTVCNGLADWQCVNVMGCGWCREVGESTCRQMRVRRELSSCLSWPCKKNTSALRGAAVGAQMTAS